MPSGLLQPRAPWAGERLGVVSGGPHCMGAVGHKADRPADVEGKPRITVGSLGEPAVRGRRGQDVSSYRAAGVLFITLLVAALSACGSATVHDPPTALRDDAITVASFNFGESEVLAEIYSEALESGGYRVKRTFGLGTRELVTPALAQGLVEFVPEYAGTALAFLSLGHEHGTSDVASTHDRLAAAAAKDNLRVLQAAPAQDANAFVVTKGAASAGGLRRLSDLSATAGRLTLGGPPECPKRPQCLL